MSLTPRQRTKINAALSLIALLGHNPRPVQAAARAAIAKGTPEAKAYTDSLNSFVSQYPAALESIGTILELVQHSDEPTLARYDAAIAAFNQTGSNAELEKLAPMIVEDFKALVVKKGLATAEELEAEEWDVSSALAVSEETFAAEPWQPTVDEIGPMNNEPNPAPQADNAQDGEPMRPFTNPAQVSPFASPTGYRPGDKRSAADQAAPAANGVPAGWVQTPSGYRRAATGEQQRQANHAQAIAKGVPVQQGTTSPRKHYEYVQTPSGYRRALSPEQQRQADAAAVREGGQ